MQATSATDESSTVKTVCFVLGVVGVVKESRQRGEASLFLNTFWTPVSRFSSGPSNQREHLQGTFSTHLHGAVPSNEVDFNRGRNGGHTAWTLQNMWHPRVHRGPPGPPGVGW